MAYCKQVAVPSQEPVTLSMVKSRLRLPSSLSTFDDEITQRISAAREDGERLSGFVLAQRQFVQTLDSFPYFTDTVQSQLAYPPSYYSLPRYSTTLWNYSQMIKVAKAPVISVDQFAYVGTDGDTHILIQGSDFILDPVNDLGRIFPMPGQYWPPCLYTPDAVKITFTGGYSPDPSDTTTYGLSSPPASPPDQETGFTLVTGIPQAFIDAICALTVYRFQNPAVAGVPQPFELAFQSPGIIDFAPTRG